MARTRINLRVIAILVIGFVFACGSTHAQVGNEPLSPREASRFLAQATLGANWEEIERTAEMGLQAWLDDQFQRPIGYHQPYLDEQVNMGIDVTTETRRWAWWQQVMEGPDPLRQRVAFALSEIYVISDNVDALANNPVGMANYYDMLLENSFGNFRDLLRDVSLHPVMGAYLSHLRNQRSDPSRGRYPDENYAREVMQLFSVGLFELNIDGTVQTDAMGAPIPTYDNGNITEFAKIFTGLSFASPVPDFFSGDPVWDRPMRMYQPFHEPGEKILLRAGYVPAGQPGMQDVEDAIDNLFNHPNTGPFIARRLIQRMVTSNPSPAYIRRVALAFNNNGFGVRGDMKAVITAILLDPDARKWPTAINATEGKLRENYLRRVHLARAFDAESLSGIYPLSDFNADTDFGQRPLSSPTVFNFFLPDHKPNGVIGDADLFAPEFQIITAVTAIASSDALDTQIYGAMNFDPDPFMEVRLDLTDELVIAPSVNALVDRLDLLLTYGNMSLQMRQIVLQAITQISDPVERTRLAIYLISISPEYAVVQ